MRNVETVLIEDLNLKPFDSILCYPKASPLELESRIKQLRQQGVTALEFVGKTSAFNKPVLGKGYVGIVVVAHVKGVKVALKMRRVDADRKDFTHEAEMLTKANQVGVGPKFLGASNNFLVMQLVDGDLFEPWLKGHMDKLLVQKVVADILEQCWQLDQSGLDHGELSKAPKHLLVDKSDKPFIVDFETASVNRKVQNVTGVCQFLFTGESNTAKLLSQVLGQKDKTKLITALKEYKKTMNRINFEALCCYLVK